MKSKYKLILAAAGIFVIGPLSSDLKAFAKAVEDNSEPAYLRFIQHHPESAYVQDAVRLAYSPKAKGGNNNGNAYTNPETGNSGKGPNKNRGGNGY